MLKDVDTCTIEDEYTLKARDVLCFHDIDHSIAKNLSRTPGFVFKTYVDNMIRTFYLYDDKSNIEIAYYPERSRVAGCVRPEDVGITISHIILKNEGVCKFCVSEQRGVGG